MYIYITIDYTNCSHGDIKLTGGKSNNEGDVQICVNGTWGYICSLTWYNINNINVLCKQLGYTTTPCKINKLLLNFCKQNIGNSNSSTNFFGGSQDIAPIVIDEIYCTGNEASLTECTYYNYYNSTCTMVAGIYCAGIYRFQFVLVINSYRYCELL